MHPGQAASRPGARLSPLAADALRAGAIDTDLPVPPLSQHIMLGSKASWVVPQVRAAALPTPPCGSDGQLHVVRRAQTPA